MFNYEVMLVKYTHAVLQMYIKKLSHDIYPPYIEINI